VQRRTLSFGAFVDVPRRRLLPAPSAPTQKPRSDPGGSGRGGPSRAYEVAGDSSVWYHIGGVAVEAKSISDSKDDAENAEPSEQIVRRSA
jgi:hypothetical protein